MKIAISGAHNSGKTTLAKWISEKHDIKYIGEQARKFLESTYSFQEIEVSLSSFMDFQREVLEAQIDDLESLKPDEPFVMDRTPVDSLAYVHYRLSSEKSSDMRYYRSYERDVNYIMSKRPYDHILFLPFQLHDVDVFYTSEEDKIRNLNPLYLKCISDFIEYWFLKREAETETEWYMRFNLKLDSFLARKDLVTSILKEE